ncbi:MAG: BlaI/MecI/CopY family transcriptional regulator [Myxococcota bacterium]
MSDPLSRRERQIMDLVYRLERVSVADVHEALPDAPTYSAVRALMGTLVDKGQLTTQRDGRRYLYVPTVPADEARSSALQRVVTTFFSGSPLEAALALVSEASLDAAELATLEDAIAKAREEGR